MSRFLCAHPRSFVVKSPPGVTALAFSRMPSLAFPLVLSLTASLALTLTCGLADAQQTSRTRDSAGIRIVETSSRAKAPVAFTLGAALIDLGGLKQNPD